MNKDFFRREICSYCDTKEQCNKDCIDYLNDFNVKTMKCDLYINSSIKKRRVKNEKKQ